MKVFISWSGERSGGLAKALKEWFPLVLDNLTLWLSKADLQAGDRWSIEIAKELEASNFGLLCITRENLNAPWILFEAGALAKSMQDGRVIPLLLDVDFKEITGPLAQFQSKKFDSSGMKELVLSLNNVCPNSVPEHTVERRFDALWADLEKQVANIPKAKSASPSKQSRPQGDILEELVAGIRHLDMRIRDLSDDDRMVRRKHRKHRIYPRIVSDISLRISQYPNDSVQLLLLTSLLRDEIPWFYELAAEVYRTSRHGQGKLAHRARLQFLEALDLLERGPFREEFGIDPYILDRIRSELESMERRHRAIQPAPKELQMDPLQNNAPDTSTVETSEGKQSD